jgi:transposase
MDIAKRAEGFREAVSKLGPRGRTTPYPKDLREEAVAYAQERRAKGATWGGIARELGIGIDSLTKWARAAERSPAKPAFRQVALAQEEVVAGAAGSGLVVHGPGGVRVEGLDVAGVAELLRRLS